MRAIKHGSADCMLVYVIFILLMTSFDFLMTHHDKDLQLLSNTILVFTAYPTTTKCAINTPRFLSGEIFASDFDVSCNTWLSVVKLCVELYILPQICIICCTAVNCSINQTVFLVSAMGNKFAVFLFFRGFLLPALDLHWQVSYSCNLFSQDWVID